MRAMILRAMVLGLMVTGCSVAADFTDKPLDRVSGASSYRIDDLPGGAYTVSVRQEGARFIPQPGQMQEDCRREATAIAVEEGARRGLRVEIDPRAARSTYGRNAILGVSSCTGQVTATPARGGG